MMQVKPKITRVNDSEPGKAGNAISTIICANLVRPDPPV